TRRRAATGEAESLLSSILGISVDRALETSGATFCAAIVKLKGQAALNRVWEAPDNLPTPEEIRDPFAWIERHGL
ncbi:MAG TPA: zinc-dependent metalloprotease, partial [Actinomycetota bacterium]|nr:zinc-dependent metalloprotease [Actinomycetota bacterium]